MRIDQLTPITSDRFWDSPLKVLLAAAFIALVAPIEVGIPFGSMEIPFTLQSFVIVLVGMMLGPGRGMLAVALYLLAGALGLPVFAEGSAGWEHLFGPTGGFLWGFIPTAGLAGYLTQRNPSNNLLSIALTWLVSHALLLALGFIWLGIARGFEGLGESLLGLMPGLILKVCVGTVLCWVLNKGMDFLIERREGEEGNEA